MKNNNTLDLINEVEKHFIKYKNFYIATLISLIIIFCWCKFGKKMIDNIDKKENFNSNNNEEIINEINNILKKIN